jgi:hypothetical protein
MSRDRSASSRASRSLLHDYQVADLIQVDGKVPLNYFTYRPNFDDLLSPWLVQQMTGQEVVIADRKKPHYVVIGSIISQGTGQSIFWGTGTYGTENEEEVPKDARYAAVRGPLTRAKLGASKGFGVSVPEVYGDPALLLPLYHAPEVLITHEYGVAVRWNERSWAHATYGPDVKLIDFGRNDVEAVIRDMLSCRKIVTSSLHGLVLADAYGVPSAWLASDSPRGGVFMFYDYFASVEKFRRPQKFDPSLEPVTEERVGESFCFNSEPIDFDYRMLLDASPLLRRKSDRRNSAAGSTLSWQSGALLRALPGREILLPSLGHFGGVAVNYLPVRFTGPVSQVRLSLPDYEDQLDLRGLQLFRNGRRVPVDDVNVTVTQSSEARSQSAQSPFAYGGIRTEKEVAPWWTATFDVPVDADELRVYNRRDGWGVRARGLTVAVAGSGGRLQTVHSVDSDRVIERTFALLERLTGHHLDASAVLSSKERASRARRDLLAELGRRTSDGVLTHDREEQRLLASLVRQHRIPEGQTLTDDEWALLGHLLAAERLRVPSTGTSMQSYQLVLESRAKLTRLETEVNHAGEILGTPQAVLTRHGFTDVGALQKRSDEYVGLMQRAAAVLNECGYPAMLAYGTLLGAMREGNFLAHDDDVDMLIPTKAGTREAVENTIRSLSQQLRSRGWRVSRPNSYTNFHLTEPSTKLHVDVFPLLVTEDRTSLHMEKMKLREIPTDIVLPPRSFTFLGQQMLVPANPEAFLAERYGHDWTTPDPFYDWPWKLQS